MKVAFVDGIKTCTSSFERAAFATILSQFNNKNSKSAEEIAAARWAGDRNVVLAIKAAASPGSTGTSGWSAEIAGNAFGEFLSSLAPHSAMAQIIPGGLLSLFTGSGVKLHPYRSSAAAPFGWVTELDSIPVTSQTISQAVLTPKKMAIINVLSRELTKYADAEAMFGGIFREDAGFSLDAAYFSALSGTSARHPGLLYGVTAASPSVIDPKENLAQLAGEVSTGGSGEVIFVTSPDRAARFPILNPESKATVLASAYVPADRVIAVDPRGLVHGYGPAPEIIISTEGTVHMSDAPLPISASGVADPVRSLYQTDSIGLRCILEIAFAKRRSNAVSFMDGCGW